MRALSHPAPIRIRLHIALLFNQFSSLLHRSQNTYQSMELQQSHPQLSKSLQFRTYWYICFFLFIIKV